MQYFVYSTSGVLFEEKTSGMMLQNMELGTLSATLNGLIPGDFRSDFQTNYTLSLKAENYEKNMAFTVVLPPEITFGENNPACSGITGSSGSIACETDRSKKTLFFPNVFTFYDADPGVIKVEVDKLRNPKTNLVTQSFIIAT